MLLGAKRIAFLGLLLAFTVILVALSSVLEMSTLFILAAASFCVGIAIRECGLLLGVGFFIASIILSLILAPNKLYCLTFSALSLYIVLIEFMWEKLANVHWNHRKGIFWIVKFIVFNFMFIPMLFIMPELFYTGIISRKIMIMALLVGQIGLLIYDRAYDYFQRSIWGKWRGQLKINSR